MTEEAAVYETVDTPEQVEAAKAQGWKDNKDHPNYKSAAQFLEDGEKIASIGAERNQKLTAELATMRQEFAALREDIVKERVAGERAGYERALKKLEARKAAAFENEDVDELKAIEREVKDLKPPKEREPGAPPPNPEFIAWRSNGNEWYTGTTPIQRAMTAYADSILDEVKATSTTNAELYQKIEARVKQEFPSQFKDHTRPPAAVETGGGKKPQRTGGKKDWASLPKATRDEIDANGYVDRYFNGDKEAYAKKYYSQFEE